MQTHFARSAMRTYFKRRKSMSSESSDESIYLQELLSPPPTSQCCKPPSTHAPAAGNTDRYDFADTFACSEEPFYSAERFFALPAAAMTGVRPSYFRNPIDYRHAAARPPVNSNLDDMVRAVSAGEPESSYDGFSSSETDVDDRAMDVFEEILTIIESEENKKDKRYPCTCHRRHSMAENLQLKSSSSPPMSQHKTTVDVAVAHPPLTPTQPQQDSSAGTPTVQLIDTSTAQAILRSGTGKMIFTFADSAAIGGQPFYTTATQQARNVPTVFVAAPTGGLSAPSVQQMPPVMSANPGFLSAESAMGHGHAHATRASPQTVQWLVDNYETAEGVSLPRSTLYNHYLRHCQSGGLEPVNAASFGKLIRSVFLGLRTRRLGTRGNSKYHYYGIRIKPSSPLNALTQEDDSLSVRAAQGQLKNKFPKGDEGDISGGMCSTATAPVASQQQDSQSQQSLHLQYIGDPNPALPSFEDLSLGDVTLPDGVTENDVSEFLSAFREHSEMVLDTIVTLQLNQVESLWSGFWQSLEEGASSGEHDFRFAKAKLHILCSLSPFVHYIQNCEFVLYQTVIDALIPDVLKQIPGSLTQTLRNFAKNLEGWMQSALKDYPIEFVASKILTVSAFAQTLRRYTSLNHLAQAARAVLQNPHQISQMLSDLNRVDFNNIQEQASWVCQCEDTTVQQLEQDFKMTLQQQNSLEQWAMWLDTVATRVLQPFEGQPEFSKAARQFLLKWSFYSSMIIRDLTLRSAASFGSFHLIRLLYDEYMFYLIEHRIATATGRSPIAVMAEYMEMDRNCHASNNGTIDGVRVGEDDHPAKRARSE
eukprot:m.129196 g.129196  ORF g.129196 m.129196 type:complete len:818 (+) comp37969_c1_seq3:796-3249(+)